MENNNCYNEGRDNTPNSVPYIVHESEMARAERHNKRLCALLVITMLFWLISMGAWLWVWYQYDYYGETTETVTIDGKYGTANYIGNNGDITNGEDYSENSETEHSGEETEYELH